MSRDVRERAQAAREAALELARTSDDARRAAVRAFADLLEERRDEVEAANRKDVEAAEGAVAAGEMTRALLDRLHLTGVKLDEAIRGVRTVADLPDPVGRTLRRTLLDDDLVLEQRTVPLGVLGCVFESRPDAAVQIACLSMRTGNAVLLKGGSEAAATNEVAYALAREALASAGLPADGVVGLRSRGDVADLLELDELVDLVIPRGSYALVRHVKASTRIPVLGHAEGVCHTYVDAAADLDRAVPVCVDAKVDYPAACNATECILVHGDVAQEAIPRIVEALEGEGVTVRAGERAHAIAPGTTPATDEDLGREYGDLTVHLRVVHNLDEAIAYINRHGSGHTDAILTEDDHAARRFTREVVSSGVFVNASTRFSDGYRYGLGAEVGISTGKVHARGPVGPEGLTTTTWILEGRGHLTGDYHGEGARPFKHEPLPLEADEGGR